MKPYLLVCVALSAFFYIVFADVDVKNGKLRLTIEDYEGAIFLYRKNDEGSYVSLLDSKRYSVNSGFYVLTGKNVQKLTRSGGVRIKSSETEKGVELLFTLKDKLNCAIMFTFLAAGGKEVDAICVDVSLLNTGDKQQLMGLRLFLDTWLGENSGRHFSTALQNSIPFEYLFTDISKEQWVESSNGDVAMRLLLWGQDITKVQTISVANKDVLGIPVWAPRFVPDRKFDSIQSYNNSAVSIVWEPKCLEPQAEFKVRFYITTGAGQLPPADLKALHVESSTAVFPSDTQNPSAETVTSANRDEYIRSLIARVHELEANPDSISREEILKLSAEIDAVLLKSGQ